VPSTTAEAALAKKDNSQGRALVKEARELVAAMPVTESEASSRETAAAFTGGKEKGARQAELEQQWASLARERYAQARAKAEEAQTLAR
jgi:phosphoglycerate transport regulatory protein PgtC